jgi:hypothetical protein
MRAQSESFDPSFYVELHSKNGFVPSFLLCFRG